MIIPKVGQTLAKEHISTLEAFATATRRASIEMLINAQSGHTGGSLGCADIFAVLYGFIISQTGEQVVVSNGHISPIVYSTLAELGYIPKKDVIKGFRKVGSVYEGHVTREVPGVTFGTGPLGIGVSVAASYALAKKMRGEPGFVYCFMGDGEFQEGQVHEMIEFAAKYQLDNLILIVDYNEVQLTDSLEDIMPINVHGHFKASGWNVMDMDGHNYRDIWNTLGKAQAFKNKNPRVIIAKTIMGKGVDFTEKEGKKKRATWHGKAPKPEQREEALKQLELTPRQEKLIDNLKKKIRWIPNTPYFPKLGSPVKVATGIPIEYPAGTVTDCRSAYGNALLDLVKKSKKFLALTADLRGSVKTDAVAEKYPERHIECGIAEQNMVSVAGGLSLSDYIPFASTFGAFMTSRAKDQARVNDINRTNVKMVATHCGLSVGEDGPTHQAIDDMGSMLGLFNTMVIEPADANQCDRIIRYVASHYGNYYVRMGRHKLPVITKENGKIFYDKNYKYTYGKSDVIRKGKHITIAATGAMVHEALLAYEILKQKAPKLSIEIVAVSSIKKFDTTLLNSIKKTKKVITVEDHNPLSGLGGMLSAYLTQKGIPVKKFETIGVTAYQYSGTAQELYKKAGIDSTAIIKKVMKLL